jgi:hypothetical protein
MSETNGMSVSRDTLLLAAVLVVGVVAPGIARYLLGKAGYTTLGMIVFALGYGAMVVVVWWGWIRPLNLTGPEGDDR